MNRGPSRLFTLTAGFSLLVCVALLLAWGRAQFGDALWVRFVDDSILMFGADAEGVRPAQGYFFDHTIHKNDPRFYEGPSGLLRILRGGGIYGRPAQGWRFAGVEVYTSPQGVKPDYRVVV